MHLDQPRWLWMENGDAAGQSQEVSFSVLQLIQHTKYPPQPPTTFNEQLEFYNLKL